MYLVVACVLAAFNIEPTLDEDGNPQMPKAEFHSVIIRYVFLLSSTLVVVMFTVVARRYISEPKHFKCAIRPRSEGAVKLVKDARDRMSF